MNEPLSVVAEFPSLMEAEVCRGVLESAGLEARLLDAHILALNPWLRRAVGGVKLVVPESQAGAARRILHGVHPRPERAVRCPECGSTDTGRDRPSIGLMVFLAFTVGAVSAEALSGWKCRACGARWQSRWESERKRHAPGGARGVRPGAAPEPAAADAHAGRRAPAPAGAGPAAAAPGAPSAIPSVAVTMTRRNVPLLVLGGVLVAGGLAAAWLASYPPVPLAAVLAGLAAALLGLIPRGAQQVTLTRAGITVASPEAQLVFAARQLQARLLPDGGLVVEADHHPLLVGSRDAGRCLEAFVLGDSDLRAIWTRLREMHGETPWAWDPGAVAYCPACGAQYHEQAAGCSDCGRPLEAVPAGERVR